MELLRSETFALDALWRGFIDFAPHTISNRSDGAPTHVARLFDDRRHDDRWHMDNRIFGLRSKVAHHGLEQEPLRSEPVAIRTCAIQAS
jgi:hypothetical protein